jgi:flagellar basal body-associated protein FliL
MIKNKRGSAWIWIIIVLILVAVGIGVYFWLSGGDAGSAVNAGANAGSSIPQPPALPSG